MTAVWRAVAIAAATLVSLAGCAVQLPRSAVTSADLPARDATEFVLTGRLSVRIDDRVDAGGFRWERNARGDTIGLFTPLGTQVAQLVREPDGKVTLTRGGDVRTAESAAGLTGELLGVKVDLDRVADWLQGRALDPEGRADYRTSDGRDWQVVAERSNAQGVTRLSLVSGATVVRFVIDAVQAR